jgi:hypothetical protein
VALSVNRCRDTARKRRGQAGLHRSACTALISSLIALDMQGKVPRIGDHLVGRQPTQLQAMQEMLTMGAAVALQALALCYTYSSAVRNQAKCCYIQVLL